MNRLFVLLLCLVSLANANAFVLRNEPRGVVLSLDATRRHYYPHSARYFEEALKRLNSKNVTTQLQSILRHHEKGQEDDMDDDMGDDDDDDNDLMKKSLPQIQIILHGGLFRHNVEEEHDDDGDDLEEPSEAQQRQLQQGQQGQGQEGEGEEKHDLEKRRAMFRAYNRKQQGQEIVPSKSEHFEVLKNYGMTFVDVGGYRAIKEELQQTVDLLRNHTKYAQYNVRVPKGLVLEGPPGNGKTMLAKALAGECGCGFIAVSGADFQEKYVGVGASRIKELFALAKKNVPCIVFVDEIDAVGRRRAADGESSSSERDNTLNALLVELDGFKNNTGIFLVGATNRVDLLDTALMRPGRIDKTIFVGLPDAATRQQVLAIHAHNKPYASCVDLRELVDATDGLSCAQIENVLNEALLLALRQGRHAFQRADVETMLNRMIGGWQATDHTFSPEMVERITVHEMGHALLGFLAKHHSKLVKVVLNLSSPKTPGYTVFAPSASIYLKDALFEHLVVLLGGRIAEEVVYNMSITTGAINDFEEALKLAQRMVVYYGMSQDKIVYSSNSEKYKELIDDQVDVLLQEAYLVGRMVLEGCRAPLTDLATTLRADKTMTAARLQQLLQERYPAVLEWKELF